VIGVASTGFLLVTGRLSGISGIVENFLVPGSGWSKSWSCSYVAGLVAAGLLTHGLLPGASAVYGSPVYMDALAGLLVGFGTRLGHGCTSGHGICGLPRFSMRSLVAVGTFMCTGSLAAYAKRYLVESNTLPGLMETVPFSANTVLAVAIPSVVTFGVIYSILSLRKGTTSSTAQKNISLSNLAVEHLSAFICAGLFGYGLQLSGMCSTERVVRFLDFSSPNGWDPTLMGVMGGGVAFNVVSFYLLRRWNPQAMTCPMPKDSKESTTMQKVIKMGGHCDNTAITSSLVLGSAIFGIGWGLAGICPGPAIVSLGMGSKVAGVFVPSLLVGMAVHEVVKPSPSSHVPSKKSA